MLRFFAAILIVVSATMAAHAVDAPAFQAGQMWTVKDSDSMKVVIGRIEPFPGGRTAVSVSIFGLPCPPTLGCTTTVLGHAPFDSQTLAASVDKLVATNAQTAPRFEEGYADWKQAKGGVYKVPVSQMPEIMAKTLASGVPHKSE